MAIASLSGERGSSPRVRGTLGRAPNQKGGRRFIPAGAGNAQGITWETGCSAVHPRGCGERRVQVIEFLLRVGSSPRVRGTPRARQLFAWPVRFIPAGAGNAILAKDGKHTIPVHPRGCGERSFQAPYTPSNAGSSPRVRGTLTAKLVDRWQARFIPAGAGNALRVTDCSTKEKSAPKILPKLSC